MMLLSNRNLVESVLPLVRMSRWRDASPIVIVFFCCGTESLVKKGDVSLGVR